MGWPHNHREDAATAKSWTAAFARKSQYPSRRLRRRYVHRLHCTIGLIVVLAICADKISPKTLIATPGLLQAPEMMLHGNWSLPVDIWAFGIMVRSLPARDPLARRAPEHTALTGLDLPTSHLQVAICGGLHCIPSLKHCRAPRTISH